MTTPGLADWLKAHAREDVDRGRPVPPIVLDLIRELLQPERSSENGTKSVAPETIDVGVNEMAFHMGCSPEWVRRLCRAGRLNARRLGRRDWLITVEGFDGQQQHHGGADLR